MIPHKLLIKNFLSYGNNTQEINFFPYNLICLSGKNGHGKSALLDAMTWALWGQARKTASTNRADAGLMHLGQTHMAVTFDFEINDVCYRVKREYIHTRGKPHASLEFGILDLETSEYRALTDKTIRTTQARIEQTTKLGFEAFINSSFLRQGNADEFSGKSPKDRKQIVGSILGLNEYEQLKKKALEKNKETIGKCIGLKTFEEKITQELTQEKQISLSHQKAKTDLTTEENSLQSLHKQLAQCQKQSLDLTNKQKECDLLKITISHQEKEQLRLQNEIRKTLHEWRTTNKNIRSLSPYEQVTKNVQTLTAAVNEHQQTLQKKLTYTEKILTSQNELNLLEQKLSQQCLNKINEQKVREQAAQAILQTQNAKNTQLKTHSAQLNTKIASYKQTIHELEIKQKDLNYKLESIQKTETQFERRKQHYQQFVALSHSLKASHDDLAQKQEEINEGDVSCPLCIQPLPPAKQRTLCKEFQMQKKRFLHQLTRIKAIVIKLKTLIIEQHELITAGKKTLQDHATQSAQLQEQRKQLSSHTLELETNEKAIEKSSLALAQAKKTVENECHISKKLEDETSTIIQKSPEYQHTSEKLNELKQKESSLNYNAQEHETNQHKLRNAQKDLQQHERIEDSKKLQSHRFNLIEELCMRLRILRKEIDKKLQKQKTLDEAISKNIQAIGIMQESLVRQIADKESNKARLLHEIGSLEAQQKNLEQLKKEHEQNEKKISSLRNEAEDYLAIATATGKDGIQALLIEDAIPEIESEANEILSKLTNNQSHIMIESLRDLKKGGTRETLDIKISDPTGIRQYEMFSGGEAFRIDFALRIGISKLLARRAGARLQTLIIDEGFGSQDEEGLSLIMDTIHHIQDEFAKIIVVSHLPMLKEQFPVHFMVTKQAGCSSVSVIEQG